MKKMMAKCCLEKEKVTKDYMKNMTTCSICKNSVFRIDRITPELIRLVCETCGETHMIGADLSANRTNLLFWNSETEDIQ
jgi:hypothetical protein